MAMADSAVYADGHLVRRCASVEETYRLLRVDSAASGRFAWIGLDRPTGEEVGSIADRFGLHPLAVEDAVVAHQRPKLDHYGDTMFVVLRPARYLDEQEDIDVGELHVFVGPDFVISLRHAELPDLGEVRQRLESEQELLAHGPNAVLYALLDRVVDDFLPVERGVQNDVDEIESEVFGGQPEVSARIYRLSREVLQFQRASRPLLDVIDAVDRQYGDAHVEMARKLRDVRDHVSDIVDRVESHRQLLSDILTVNSSLLAQRQNEQAARLTETSLAQNEEMKKISSWAAILFTPTVVATIYGMNFTHMPELDWVAGYPMAVVLMLMVGFGLFLAFRRRGWL